MPTTQKQSNQIQSNPGSAARKKEDRERAVHHGATHRPVFHCRHSSKWEMKEIIQSPASHMASQEQDPPQSVSMGWSDGKEGEAEQLEHYD